MNTFCTNISGASDNHVCNLQAGDWDIVSDFQDTNDVGTQRMLDKYLTGDVLNGPFWKMSDFGGGSNPPNKGRRYPSLIMVND